jgi:ribonuclease HI
MPLPDATNQRAEIRAAAYALNELPPLPKVVVVSDSEYVVKGMTVRIGGWRDRARDGVWRKASGGAVENQTDWQRLIDAASRHGHVEFEWTRGHVGTHGNSGEHGPRGLFGRITGGTSAGALLTPRDRLFSGVRVDALVG